MSDDKIQVDERGVAKATSVSTTNKDGGTDVTIQAPRLRMIQKMKEESDGVRNLSNLQD